MSSIFNLKDKQLESGARWFVVKLRTAWKASKREKMLNEQLACKPGARFARLKQGKHAQRIACCEGLNVSILLSISENFLPTARRERWSLLRMFAPREKMFPVWKLLVQKNAYFLTTVFGNFVGLVVIASSLDDRNEINFELITVTISTALFSRSDLPRRSEKL